MGQTPLVRLAVDLPRIRILGESRICQESATNLRHLNMSRCHGFAADSLKNPRQIYGKSCKWSPTFSQDWSQAIEQNRWLLSGYKRGRQD
jgi:hypothetical protein